MNKGTSNRPKKMYRRMGPLSRPKSLLGTMVPSYYRCIDFWQLSNLKIANRATLFIVGASEGLRALPVRREDCRFLQYRAME
jgi:hypothetical protein